MQQEIANLVHPLLVHGLQLRERLEKGETVNLDIEQATLKGLLLTDAEARRYVDFGGDGGRGPAGSAAGNDSGHEQSFLGVRYALVCWLDELFILFSPWQQQWNERKLEVALYGTNDRAWKFWEQARLAEKRPGTDALQVYFLCVMLGFHGELWEAPEKLQQWVDSIRARLASSFDQAWQPPPALDFKTNVPPLRAQLRFQQMVMVGGLVLLLMIPLLAFVIVHQMGQ